MTVDKDYRISRTVVPLLIIAIPIAAMIAWILYQGRDNTPADSVPAAAGGIEIAFGSDNWPIFRGDSRLTGRAEGQLPDDLALAWTFQTDGEIAAAPVIAGGAVYVSSIDKHLYAINLRTGTEKWRFQADDQLFASPLYFNGTVYVGSNRGTFYAVDAETGQNKWTFDEAGEIAGSANIGQQDGRTVVVFGSYDNNLYCLDAADGTLVYQHPAENYINGAVAIADNTAFFGSCDANLYEVPLDEPTDTRTLDTGSYIAANPAIDGTVVYVGNYEGTFLAADITTQQVLWRYEHESRDAFFSSPAVDEAVVLVGCRDRKLYCFDKQTGNLRWTFSAGGNFDSSPVICGSRVAVGNDDGRLYIVDVNTGRQVFSYTLGSTVTASPAIAGNALLIGADNGILYAFTAK